MPCRFATCFATCFATRCATRFATRRHLPPPAAPTASRPAIGNVTFHNNYGAIFSVLP
jgi:hypothetical protein